MTRRLARLLVPSIFVLIHKNFKSWSTGLNITTLRKYMVEGPFRVQHAKTKDEVCPFGDAPSLLCDAHALAFFCLFFFSRHSFHAFFETYITLNLIVLIIY